MLSLDSIRTLLPSANIKTISLERPSGVFRNYFDRNKGLVDAHSARPGTYEEWTSSILSGKHTDGTDVADIAAQISHMQAAANRSKDLRVDVRASIVTTADNPFNTDLSQTGEFLLTPEINFNDHLYVALIQSTDAALSQMLQSMGDTILKYLNSNNEFRGNSKFDDFIICNILPGLDQQKTDAGNSGFFGRMRVAALSNRRAETLASYKNAHLSTQIRKVYGDMDKPVFDKMDKNGKRVMTIPMNFEFMLPTHQPQHLSYFIITYLDFQGLAETLQTNYTRMEYFGANTWGGGDLFSPDANPARQKSGVVEMLDLQAMDFEGIGAISTPLNYDTVFENGVLSGKSYFFQTLDGKTWTGPVHKMGDPIPYSLDNGGQHFQYLIARARADRSGKYMTGNNHLSAQPGQHLNMIETENVKIQDFRNRNGILRTSIMSDFQDEEATMKRIIGGFQPRERSLNPTTNNVDAYVSDVFLAAGARKSAKFMFLVDFDSLLTKNSIFGRTIKTQGNLLRKNIFALSRIKSLKIYREKVKKGVGANSLGDPMEKIYVDQNEPSVLVAHTGQRKHSKAITPTSSIVEETNMSFSNSSVRAFNVIDKGFLSTSQGQYQYRLEMEVVDHTIDYFRGLIDNLVDFGYALQNYLSDVINASIRPYNENTSHDNRRKAGYDPRLNSLTGDFALLMRQKYYTAENMAPTGAHNPPSLAKGIGDFVTTLKVFLQNQNFTPIDQQRVENFLSLIVNPATTTPESILSVIEMVDKAVNKMASFVGMNVEMTNPVQLKAQNIIGSTAMEKGVIYINKSFSTIHDLSHHDGAGYDYLSIKTGQTIKDSWNQVGLRSLSGAEFRERVNREILKFYKNTNPDITAGLTAQGVKFAGGDSVHTTALSFLSPSMLKMERVIDLLNGGHASNGGLSNMLESRLILTRQQVASSHHQAPLDPFFRKQLQDAATEQTENQQIASPSHAEFLAQYKNLIPSPATKPLTLVDRQMGRTNSLESQQSYSSQTSTPLDPLVANSTNFPASFFSRVAHRDLTKSHNANPSVLNAAVQTKESIPQGIGIMQQTNFNPFGEQAKNVKNIRLWDINQQHNILRGVPQSQVRLLPNQIKALISSLNGSGDGGVRDRLQTAVRKNVFNNPDESASARLKYNLLVEIQYLSGFSPQKTSSERAVLIQAPIWKKLDQDTFSKNVGKKIICRLKKFEIPEWNIFRPEQLDIPIYDKYFIIEPDVPMVGASGQNLLTNPLSNALSRAGKANLQLPSWTSKAAEHSSFPEFGFSNLPTSNIDLSSCRLHEIISQLSELTNSVRYNPIAEAFIHNTAGCEPECPDCNDDPPPCLTQKEMKFKLDGQEPWASMEGDLCNEAPTNQDEPQCSTNNDCQPGQVCVGGECVIDNFQRGGGDDDSTLFYAVNLPGLRAALRTCTSLLAAFLAEKQMAEQSLIDVTNERNALASNINTLTGAAKLQAIADVGAHEVTIGAIQQQLVDVATKIEGQKLCESEALLAIQKEMQDIQARVIQDQLKFGDVLIDQNGNEVQCMYPEQLGAGLNEALGTLQQTQIYSTGGETYAGNNAYSISGGAYLMSGGVIAQANAPGSSGLSLLGAGTSGYTGTSLTTGTNYGSGSPSASPTLLAGGIPALAQSGGGSSLGLLGDTENLQATYEANLAAIASTGQVDDFDAEALAMFSNYLSDTADMALYDELMAELLDDFGAVGASLQLSIEGFSTEIFELAVDMCTGSPYGYAAEQENRMSQALMSQATNVHAAQFAYLCPFQLFYGNANQHSGQTVANPNADNGGSGLQLI